MPVLTFKPRFAELVAAGVKTQTIRPPRKVPLHVGDRLSLRQWSGRPYHSPQLMLREATCIGLSAIGVASWGVALVQAKVDLQAGENDARLNDFARADGFEDWPAMRDWFDAEHHLPFVGILIRWKVDP